MSDSLWPHRLYSPWNSPGQNTGMGSLSLLQGIFLGIEPRSPTLQADSLPAQSQGKPKNTGVGSLSLLQGIFPTQESNRGLLNCRWILYPLSYQGSPSIPKRQFNTNLKSQVACVFIVTLPVSTSWPWASYPLCDLSLRFFFFIVV